MQTSYGLVFSKQSRSCLMPGYGYGSMKPKKKKKKDEESKKKKKPRKKK